jgi:hypothetical protein
MYLTTEGDVNSCIEAYRGSIQAAIDLINGQWRDCTWDKCNLISEAPTFADEVLFTSLSIVGITTTITIVIIANYVATLRNRAMLTLGMHMLM